MISTAYERLIRPLLFTVPPETVHHIFLNFLSSQVTATGFSPLAKRSYPELHKKLFGLHFRNPIGLAAGFDKNGIALPSWDGLGFGFAEIGTVTPLPQPGNPPPRLFRLPEEKALINRLGFPNEGADVVAERLDKIKRRGSWPRIPIGINIGKNKDTPLERAAEDYLKCFRRLRPYADYFAINVSSPNTPGLRDLQNKEALTEILRPIMEENRHGATKPILLKIAPDLSESDLDPILEAVAEQKIDGIIATNTTVDKSNVTLQEAGGLSGAPLRSKSTEIIRVLHRKTDGMIPIIGVGGIFNAADAREKLEAGASLLQLYTGFIYEGPLVVSQICGGLVSRQ